MRTVLRLDYPDDADLTTYDGYLAALAAAGLAGGR